MYKYKFITSLAYNYLRQVVREKIETAPFMSIQKEDAKKVHQIYEKLEKDWLFKGSDENLETLERVRDLTCYIRLDFSLGRLAYLIFCAVKECKEEVPWMLDEDSNYGVADSFFEDIIENLQSYKPEDCKLSDWIPDEHCAYRVIESTVKNEKPVRVAFIEKSARVRFVPDNKSNTNSNNKWYTVLRGAGGEDGHIPENEIYGFYPPSRQSCDEALKLLGYEFS